MRLVERLIAAVPELRGQEKWLESYLRKYPELIPESDFEQVAEHLVSVSAEFRQTLKPEAGAYAKRIAEHWITSRAGKALRNQIIENNRLSRKAQREFAANEEVAHRYQADELLALHGLTREGEA